MTEKQTETEIKYNFKVKDRLLLVNILPSQGSFEDLIISKDIKSKIDFKQEDLELYEIKTIENNNVTWSAEKDTWIEIEFTEAEKNFISTTLKKLSEDKKLNVDLIDLYKFFTK